MFVRPMHKAHMDSAWFKARKRERKVTDAALAQALGVERSVANKVVNGKVEMNARRVDAVAALLDVTRDELLFRAGISSEPPSPDAGEKPDPVKTPSAEEIAGMIRLAMSPLPVGVSFEDYPQAVATSLSEQLRQYQAGGGYTAEGEANAPGTDAPPPKPTKPGARAKSRTP